MRLSLSVADVVAIIVSGVSATPAVLCGTVDAVALIVAGVAFNAAGVPVLVAHVFWHL